MPVSPVPSATAVPPSASPTLTPAWVWRLRHAIVCALLVAVSLNSDPGLQVADTKHDLVVDPFGLLTRGLHLWDPSGSAGQLQDQAYGYLFPMGPFFALGSVLGVPGWVTQRLWWGLVLSVGYVGFVVLARRLGLGSEWTRLVAGVAFAVWPHVLANLGRASVEVWPPALAAWVLVPLVGAGGQDRPRRAAALSGLAVLAMGGVNATVDLAAVLPAALWLLTRGWSRAWLRLAALWAAAVLAATVWWVVPLLALGRYSPPFLDFIESASVTTSTTTLVEALRGTADWVSYLGDSASRAGFALLTQPLLILFTVLLVALGVGGLAWRRTAERAWLVLMLAVGLALVALGHLGPVDGFFAADLRALLDGPLAALRNVHKFDILIRLALTLGAASALAGLSRGRTRAETAFLRPVVAATGVFLVVGAAAPFFGLRVANPGSFAGIPDYWTEASSWLEEHDGAGRTLLVPGSRFPEYTWGRTGDEPIQSLGQAPWDVRNAVPLTDPGHIRWLDAVERRIAEGRGGADLAAALRTAGVRYLLARNDLDYGRAGATRPLAVRAALSATPGVSVVRTFGPPVGGGSTPERFVDGGLSIGVPALEVYRVSGASDSPARLVPASSVAGVVGGAEASFLPGVADLATTVLAADGPEVAAAGGVTVLTDTPRRREANFGLGTPGISQTLALDEPLRISKPTRDYGWSDAPGAEAAVRWYGARSVTASSSAADADAYPRPDQSAMPFSALDDSDRTLWRPNPLRTLTGSWLDVDLGRAVPLAGGRVRLDEGSAITALEVRTDEGTVVLPVHDDTVQLPRVTTRELRIVVASAGGSPAAQRSAGIRAVSIPHVDISRSVVLPSSPWPSGPDRVVLSGDAGQGSCYVLGDRPLCAPTAARTGEDAAGLDRTVDLPSDLTGTLVVTARPLGGPALDALLEHALGLDVHAEASSAAMPDAAAGALSAVDGDLGTAWVASPSDPDPALTLSWDEERSVSSLQVVVDPYAALTRPTRVRITSGSAERTVDLDASGVARFPAVRTSSLTVHLSAPALATSVDAYTVEQSFLGLGASEVRIPGLTPELTVHRPSLARRVTIACGEGPGLSIDGRPVGLEVSTTVGELLRGSPVTARTCSSADGGAPPVTLPAGEVRVRAGTPDRWVVASVVVTRDGGRGTGPEASLPAPVVGTWDRAHRTLAVGERPVPAVLVVDENANAGWRATLDGVRLDAVTVGGWQQGYLLPPGRAGQVRLDFAPDRPVRWGMALGALVAVALLVAGLLPQSPRRRPVEVAGRAGRAAVVGVVLTCVGLVAGWWGLLVAAAVAGVGVVVARRRAPSTAPVATTGAVLAVLAAGAVLLSGPYGSVDYRADHPAAQLLCVAALSFLALALVAPARSATTGPESSGSAGSGVRDGSAAAPGSGS